MKIESLKKKKGRNKSSKKPITHRDTGHQLLLLLLKGRDDRLGAIELLLKILFTIFKKNQQNCQLITCFNLIIRTHID
jgi:hypothetical protein